MIMNKELKKMATTHQYMSKYKGFLQKGEKYGEKW